jgi:hypothetical protein
MRSLGVRQKGPPGGCEPDSSCPMVVWIRAPAHEPVSFHAVERGAEARGMDQEGLPELVHAGLGAASVVQPFQRAEDPPLGRADAVASQMGVRTTPEVAGGAGQGVKRVLLGLGSATGAGARRGDGTRSGHDSFAHER